MEAANRTRDGTEQHGPGGMRRARLPGGAAAVTAIAELRRAGQVGLIDSLVVESATGAVSTSELVEYEEYDEATAEIGPEVDLLGPEDAAETAETLEPGSCALMLLVEHVWAARGGRDPRGRRPDHRDRARTARGRRRGADRLSRGRDRRRDRKQLSVFLQRPPHATGRPISRHVSVSSPSRACSRPGSSRPSRRSCSASGGLRRLNGVGLRRGAGPPARGPRGRSSAVRCGPPPGPAGPGRSRR